MATFPRFFNRFSYETDETFRKLSTKQQRVEHILRTIDFPELMKHWIESFYEETNFKINPNNAKALSQVGDYLYEPNQKLFERTSTEALDLVTATLRNTKVNSVEELTCHVSLAKLSARMKEYESALVSISHVKRIALNRLFDPSLYYDKTLVFLKLVCLHSLSNIQGFYEFWNECLNAKVELTDDSDIKSFAELLQVSHLSFVHFENFANYNLLKDDNAQPGESTTASESTDEEVDDLSDIFEKQQYNHFTDEALQLVIDPNRGRYMIANESIEKGKVILIEKALLLGFERSTSKYFCLNCHKNIANKFVPCYSCPDAVYCNENCRVEAYDTFHWKECGIVNFYKDPNDFHLQLMRQLHLYYEVGKGPFKDYDFSSLIQEYVANKNIQETSLCDHSVEDRQLSYALQQALHDNNSVWEDYYDAYYFPNMFHIAVWYIIGSYIEKTFVNNQESKDRVPLWNLSKDQIDHLRQRINEIPEKWTKETPFFDVTVNSLIEILAALEWNLRKLQTNSFGWHIEDENCKHVSVAGCTCLLASFINHSCDPNVEWEFHNGYILYRTIKDICAGEEINNCYGPSSNQTFVNRQKHLANNYNYNCNCSLCKKQMLNYQLKQNCPLCKKGTIVFNMRTQLDASCSECFFRPDQNVFTQNIEIGWSIHVSNSIIDMISPPSRKFKYASDMYHETYFEDSLNELKNLISPRSNAWQNTLESLVKHFPEKTRKSAQIISELHTTEPMFYQWDEQSSNEDLTKLLRRHALWMNALEGYPAAQIHRQYGQKILVDLENRLSCHFEEDESNSNEFEIINCLSMQFFK